MSPSPLRKAPPPPVSGQKKDRKAPPLPPPKKPTSDSGGSHQKPVTAKKPPPEVGSSSSKVIHTLPNFFKLRVVSLYSREHSKITVSVHGINSHFGRKCHVRFL